MDGDGFSRLADVLPEPVLVFTTAGTLEALNRSARLAFPGAAAGQPFTELFVDTDSRARRYLRECARIRRPIPGAFTDLRSRVWQARGALYQPGGNGAPPRVILRLDEEADASARFVALNQQLEALRGEMRTRREAEASLRREREWLRVTLMSIGDAVVATDVRAQVVFMNPVAQSLTGWRDNEAIGQPVNRVFRIIDETSRRAAKDPVAEVLRDGRAVGLANHTLLLARDGTEWPIDDSAAPIKDEHGEILGVVLVFHTTTERRKLDLLQRQRIEELEREARLKDEFLAMLAHELRNPLAPLLTAAGLLEGTPPPALVERVRRVLDRQVRHLARLVDDLLDVSRITRGRIELRREGVDVPAVVAAAVEGIRPQVEQRGHRLEVSVAAGTPPVEADPVRLEQVLSNLLSNAVKYTPPGGRIELEAGGREALEITVRDDGVGIDPELLPRVFDPFVQGDRSLDRSEGGLGIGLTLVKHLIELHGGTCSIHSEGAGRGVEVRVRLPVASATAATAAPVRRPRRGADLRVLVVDDHRDAADMLAQSLTARGHFTCTAYDGPTGLERARLERPDVALLDIGLPGMDGYELGRRIRRTPGLESCVLVAITGYGQDADRRRSAEAGFTAHLLKPIDPATLQDILGSVAKR
jgi:PAS domain S-box-containing protein